MRGSIFRRGTLYVVQIELDRDPVSGRRRREWHSGYATRRDAEAARVEILGRLQRGEHVAPQKLTLGGYLLERRLPTRESQLAPSTFESYRHNVRHHIVPKIGSARLQGLSADVLTRFYGDRLTSGLSARTVRYLHAIIARRWRTRSRGGSWSATWPTLHPRRRTGPPRRRRRPPDQRRNSRPFSPRFAATGSDRCGSCTQPPACGAVRRSD